MPFLSSPRCIVLFLPRTKTLLSGKVLFWEISTFHSVFFFWNSHIHALVPFQLNSDVDLNRIVYAPAPEVASARFTDTGAKIIVAFNSPIAASQLTTCAAIFSTGLSSLGTSPTCSWSDARHLEISPDVDAAIEPSNSLTFVTDAIKQDQMFSKVLNGAQTISGPENPVQPAALIVGRLF
jgi:hypothetical protein